METLTIKVPNSMALRLKKASRELGISLDDLIKSGIEEKLENMEKFEKASDYALKKNKELYKRLA